MHSHVLPMPPWTCTAVSHTVRGGACAVRLRDATRGERGVGREVVDGPRRVQCDAVRTLHETVRFREQVLHGLEGPDGHAVLAAVGGVLDGHGEHAAHDADEIGAREREAERGPGREVVVGERADRWQPAPPSIRGRRGARRV